MKKKLNIVGGGLAGCAVASRFPDAVIYEKDEFIGGLCRDNKNYQEFVHILHTDSDQVWDFFNRYTAIRPHQTILKSYVKGEIKNWPVPKMTFDVILNQIKGYSKKMWLKETPREAFDRIITNDDGLIFHEKYEGVPDFSKLFHNITKGHEVRHQNVRDGDLDGTIVLTGAIDEYFDYCFGELPYRGMKSVHYESEIGLDGDFLTFSDTKVPFQRLVDYSRLGYEGKWIGVEIACNAKHYPMRTIESETIYKKYKKLAEQRGVILAGRLGLYRYLDMDDVVEHALNLEIAE